MRLFALSAFSIRDFARGDAFAAFVDRSSRALSGNRAAEDAYTWLGVAVALSFPLYFLIPLFPLTPPLPPLVREHGVALAGPDGDYSHLSPVVRQVSTLLTSGSPSRCLPCFPWFTF